MRADARNRVRIESLSAFVGMFQDPTNRWFALYLAVSILIGCGVYLFEARRDPQLKAAGLARFLLPAHIYTHRSAIADYWFYVINKTCSRWLLHS